MGITTRRVRHDPRFRRAEVKSATYITPHMVRIVLYSPDFEGFTSLGFDDHVRVFFPQPGTVLPVPTPGERGMIWPDPKPEHRDYTPRAFDSEALELTIDFVVHEGGIASDWAANAKRGDEIGVGGPRGSFVIEGDADWHLLMGDATALPAIGRRIEELPGGARVIAVIEVLDEKEEQSFKTDADLGVTWLHQSAGETLAGYLDRLALPDGEGFAFFAAEASVVTKARERFDALGLSTDHFKASNYWREGVSDAHEH